MMKFFNWKTFLATALVCLLPILPGAFLWNNLPDTIAVHFNIYGEADNFASKGFAVFALPALMVFLQLICCVICDVNAHKFGDRKKFVTANKWIVPSLSVALQVLTLGYALGWNLDIRKAVAVIVGLVFLVVGNYLPKFDHIKNYDIEAEKAKKINRFIGYETVIMGLLFCLSIFFPPAVTAVCLLFLVPYAIISVVYGIVTGRKK